MIFSHLDVFVGAAALDWVLVSIRQHGGRENGVMSARYGKYIQSEYQYPAVAEEWSH
jgi:hypothetical protein